MSRPFIFLAIAILIGYMGWHMGYLHSFFPITTLSRLAPVQSHQAGYWNSFKKPTDAEMRLSLSLLQYKVTQENGTETPFDNTYWSNEEPGIYVDIVSGEPLFSSLDKFDSGTGWPSFTKPIDPSAVTLHTDTTLGVARTEVRSKTANSHLGHLFTDGPQPLGTRYCMNSAALRFVAKARLKVEGYGAYAPLFK